MLALLRWGGWGAAGPETVEDDDDFGQFVHEDNGGQSKHTGDRQGQQYNDDRQRQDDVLIDDAASSPSMVQGAWDQTQIVAGEGDVCRLDRRIRACGAHGNAKVCRGQGGGVIDTIADHGYHVLLSHGGDGLSFAVRAEFSMDLVNACGSG